MTDYRETAKQAAREAVAKVYEGQGRAVNATAIRLGRFDHQIDVRNAILGALAAAEVVRAIVRAEVEREAAALVAAYYRREIGVLMQQAQHWADNGKPLAVHHRVMKADHDFQIVALMERDPAKGWKPPFDEMRESLARPTVYPEGPYPPSAELHAYRDACYVAEKLNDTYVPSRRTTAARSREAAAHLEARAAGEDALGEHATAVALRVGRDALLARAGQLAAGAAILED